MNGTDTLKDTKISGKKEGETASDIPFVSVMVLNYNYADLLVRALEACAAQTFRDFEVVLINNGAIDNTEEIYKDFCAKHPEVRTTYVHIEKNQGPMHGLNVGLEHARGEFVMIHDADDWMEPECLECMAEKVKETGTDRVTVRFRDALPDGSTGRIHNCFGDVSIHSGFLQGVIFRRSILTKYGITVPESQGYDITFTFAFAAKEEHRGEGIPRVLYNYSIRDTSLAATAFAEKAKNYYDFITKIVIDTAAEITQAGINDAVRDEIEYFTVKVAWSHILREENYLSASDWKQFVNKVQDRLCEKFPGWEKNPLLWPFGNGYNLTESVGLYVLVRMCKLRAMWMVRMACKMSSLLKLRR